MQQRPYSLKELGGLFIIIFVGLILAFIVAGIEFVIDNYPMYRQRKNVSPEYWLQSSDFLMS